jgi:hypothetical protein
MYNRSQPIQHPIPHTNANWVFRLEAAKQRAAGGSDTIFFIRNSDKDWMKMIFELDFSGINQHQNFARDPAHPERNFIMVPPNSTLELGGIPMPAIRGMGNVHWAGATRAFSGCEENGDDCAGEHNAASKIEFAIEAQGKKGVIGINDSKGMLPPSPGFDHY